MSTSFLKITRNLALVGPPGSGKGSYGRLFAQHFGVPLVTVSDVLREHAHEIPSCGKLVDDAIVCEILKNHLSRQQRYLLDGFPRTIQQVHLQNSTWPEELRIDAVIDLNVPQQVCKEKLLGRRFCTKCNGLYNVNAVHMLGFELPAQLPKDCNCNGEFFTSRPDDVEPVVDERLKAHFEETEPILEYFERRKRLLRFTPYLGYDDVPRFYKAVETWLKEMDEDGEREGSREQSNDTAS